MIKPWFPPSFCNFMGRKKKASQKVFGGPRPCFCKIIGWLYRSLERTPYRRVNPSHHSLEFPISPLQKHTFFFLNYFNFMAFIRLKRHVLSTEHFRSYYRLLGLVCPGILVALEMHSIVLVKQLNNEQNLDISCEVVCYCSRLRSIYIFSYLTLRQVDS